MTISEDAIPVWVLSHQRARAFARIDAERERQESLVRSGKFKQTCADPEMSDDARFIVLAEEFGEVAKELCELMHGTSWPSELLVSGSHLHHRERMHTELVELAAVAVAWIESGL